MALSAARALRGAADGGQPMPAIPELAELYNYIKKIYIGQVLMIAGRPGAQKSGLALWMCEKWGLPTLYFSSDMARVTVSARLAAMRTGMDSTLIREILSSNEPEDEFEADRIARNLEDSAIHFCCQPEPSLENIDDEINAWVELRDDYPKVIVIDNLMDVEPVSDNEYQSLKGIMKELQVLARQTGSLVMVTHHMKEEGDPDYPAPAKGVSGKVTQTAELTLSVALDSESTDANKPFRVSPVKTREGAGFPNANRWIELIANPATNRFTTTSFYDKVKMNGQSQ